MTHRLHDLLQIAIKMEREGAEFYRRLEAQATREDSKAIFRKLAEDEIHHERFFTSLMQGSEHENVEIDEPELDNILKAIENEEVLPDAPGEKIESIHPLQAIKLGVKTEKNTVEFYKFLLKKLDTSEGRRLLEELIEEEKRHSRELTELHKDRTFSF